MLSKGAKHALALDLRQYRPPSRTTLQESTIGLRSLAHYRARGDVPLAWAFARLLDSPEHPRFDGAIVLTASIEARRRRLWPPPDGWPISKAMTLSLRLPLVVLVASLGALATAFTAQYWGGLAPCVLCLYQRRPYAIPLGLAVVAPGPRVTKQTPGRPESLP